MKITHFASLLIILSDISCTPRNNNETLARPNGQLEYLSDLDKKALAHEKFVIPSEFEKSASAIRQAGGVWESVVDYKIAHSFVARIEKALSMELRDRGEAHITVLKPEELKAVQLVDSGTEKLTRLSKDARFQNPKFNVKCIGGLQEGGNNSKSLVFYLVVNSDQISDFRMQLRLALYGNTQCKSGEFCHAPYFSHITVGFTKNDLFPKDDAVVNKGSDSCIADLSRN